MEFHAADTSPTSMSAGIFKEKLFGMNPQKV
jgi:hypothetical protein